MSPAEQVYRKLLDFQLFENPDVAYAQQTSQNQKLDLKENVEAKYWEIFNARKMAAHHDDLQNIENTKLVKNAKMNKPILLTFLKQKYTGRLA